MNKEYRTAIPNQIKREVRQRCYFGCVHCGNPLIDYHHIIPWSEVRKHEAKNITLLCSQCHRKVTQGHYATEQVIEWDKEPHNKNEVYSPAEMLGYRLFKPEDIKKIHVEISNAKFNVQLIDTQLQNYIMIPIMIDGEPIVAFTVLDGRLSLYLKLYDENNRVAVKIVNNEVITRLDFWDITFIGKTLKINRKSHDIFIEIDFNTPYSIHIRKGYLMHNQKGFRVYSDRIKTLEKNIQLANVTVTNFLVGISMGELPENMNAGVVIKG